MSLVSNAVLVIGGSNWLSGPVPRGEFRCLERDDLLKTLDGSRQVVLRLAVQPGKHPQIFGGPCDVADWHETDTPAEPENICSLG
jgi:hypothetical protein